MSAVTMRECVIPRDGFYLCSVDFDGIELRTWSQCHLWACGHSKMAEVLNAGRDPHTELGASLGGLTAEEAYALTGDALKAFKGKWRQQAKPANFGLPGGMGWRKFQETVRRDNRLILSDEEARHVCKTWRDTWDAQSYFDWINRVTKDGTIRQFVSNRIRGGVGYTDGANTFFQGLAADAAKDAGFHVSKECYAVPSSPLFGARPIIFAHDEIIAEIPIDHAHEAAYRMRDVMVARAQRYVPDVKVTASPALMTRWIKNAEARHDAAGKLVPYDLAA